jgi:hypothetical protein
MIRTFKIAVQILTVLVALCYAPALAASPEKEQGCRTLLRHRGEALTARDYAALDRLAKQSLQDCKEVSDAEEYSMAYLDLAMTHMVLNDGAAAREATERCIDVFYSNAFCHVYKTWALIDLKRSAEARTEFEIAEKLIGSLLEKNEKDLGAATEQQDKEWHAVNEENLKASRRLLETLRTKLHALSDDEIEI